MESELRSIPAQYLLMNARLFVTCQFPVSVNRLDLESSRAVYFDREKVPIRQRGKLGTTVALINRFI